MSGINTPKQPEASTMSGSMSLNEVELDAARYKWLKSTKNKSTLGIINNGILVCGARADSEIDSAMAADKGQEITDTDSQKQFEISEALGFTSLDEVYRDAARYRWLKNEENSSSLGIIDGGIIVCDDYADDRIDSAMSAPKDK